MNSISPANTVIVACSSPDTASSIVELLSDKGFSVVGPVDRASLALAMAAQSPVTLAVVGSKLAGRRDGSELAGELMSRWGASTILFEEAMGDAAWEARGEVAGVVREIVSVAQAPPPQA